MTTSVSEIIERARYVLQDTGEVKWSDDELVGWLNDAARAIIARVPDASITTADVSLSAGVYQTPLTDAQAVRIIEISRNTSGNAVRRVDKKTLNAAKPDWPTDSQQTQVKNVMFGHDNPLAFDVYPPNNGSGSLEITYQAHVSTFTWSGTWPLNSTYTDAGMDYMLWRAFLKEADYGDPQRAEYHYQKYAEAVGIDNAADAGVRELQEIAQ